MLNAFLLSIFPKHLLNLLLLKEANLSFIFLKYMLSRSVYVWFIFV